MLPPLAWYDKQSEAEVPEKDQRTEEFMALALLLENSCLH
jgi:hypothetical protein